MTLSDLNVNEPNKSRFVSLRRNAVLPIYVSYHMALLYNFALFPEWQTAATINITAHTVLIRTSGRLCLASSPEGTLMNSSVHSEEAEGILASISARTLLQTEGTKNVRETAVRGKNPFKTKILLVE